MPIDVVSTVGASFAGCLVAVGLNLLLLILKLSAVLGFQVFLYYRIFPSDTLSYKILVGWIWATDTVHTVLLCATIWQYLILSFEKLEIMVEVLPTVAVTVAMTATAALSVDGFYGWRIHKMSKHNWWLTGPIAFLSVAQVGLAFTNAAVIMNTKTFFDIAKKTQVVFVANLFVSAVTDIIIAVARYYYLRDIKRQGYLPTQEIVDGIVVFTINDGVMTCAVAIAAVVCCLAIPHNFVFLGLYVINSKFYSNSVLATLNLRNWYRHRYTPGHRPVLMMSRATNDAYKVHGETEQRSISMLPNFGGSTRRSSVSIDRIGGENDIEMYMERQVEHDLGLIDLDTPESHTTKKSAELFHATEP
ncbi:hypothetical protein EV368DRAFT_63671 [Lentinula lateritia]|uniref:Uncharacterized protein n=1 Tax=Lentinula aff. lateritia TaxID=2804960 RepID=A0ACC1UA67_9AGAR|nr:hypothetical protein F5876DRAFT_62836 [Lentinula aff. lateritia]KAJ3853941.1 hypothetical protein EV368DRAFT_63671 [Lentinula lateritia]